MNFRNVKIAFIPEEYCGLVTKSQTNREAFLNVDVLKTILSPSEVDFYKALNSFGINFSDKAVLFSNVVNQPKGYDYPDSSVYSSNGNHGELSERIRDRLLQTFKWSERTQVNRQYLLDKLSTGIIPMSELSLYVTYHDDTCLFISFNAWMDNRHERMRQNLENIYTGLNQCGLFELSPSIQEARLKTRWSYDNPLKSWHYFCGSIFNMLIAYDPKVA